MARLITGAVVAAVATFLIGFGLHGSGLQSIAYQSLTDSQAAAVQRSLAENLPVSGSYIIPDDSSPTQVAMYQEGPVATVHYISRGFPLFDPVAIALWLILALAVALLIGIGMRAGTSGFAGRAKLVVLFSIAAVAFIRLGEPILYHLDWRYFLYVFATDALVLIVIGLILARWSVPQVSRSKVNADSRS